MNFVGKTNVFIRSIQQKNQQKKLFFEHLSALFKILVYKKHDLINLTLRRSFGKFQAITWPYSDYIGDVTYI